MDAGRVNVQGTRVEQEDVGFGTVRDVVHVSQNVCTDSFGARNHD